MKKFIALVVVLCAVLFSSTASAANLYDDDKNKSWFKDNWDKLMEDRVVYPTIDTRGKAPIVDEPESEVEKVMPMLVLTVGLIGMLFAYKYRKDRQFIKENSLAVWLSNFVGMKNFWFLIFCIISLMTCIFYVPYYSMNQFDQSKISQKAYGKIYKLPKGFYKPELTRINYEEIVYREVLILLGCCAGYTASTIIKNK